MEEKKLPWINNDSAQFHPDPIAKLFIAARFRDFEKSLGGTVRSVSDSGSGFSYLGRTVYLVGEGVRSGRINKIQQSIASVYLSAIY